MPQLEILPFYNQGLFSNNYLEYHLPQTAIWSKSDEQIIHARKEISLAYKNIKSLNLGPGEEASLEEKLIRPVLKILGYELDIQPTTQRGAKKKRPDYALFKDKESLEEAHKDKNNLTRFFSHPLTILEAKYWGRRLNDADAKDKLDARDPTAQTVKYLDDVYHASEGRIQWAILTNGKVWRLFYYRASSRSGNFYDIDLEAVLQSESLDAFKYFYLFFSRDAFLTDPVTGRSWLDQHLKGSEDYAARVSAELKDLIFDKVFEGLATGFIEYRRSEIGIKKETEEGLKEVFKGCLTLLYRLLFLLYAESRGLLPVDDQNRYCKKSLKKLKEDIARDISTAGLDGMSRNAYDYWSRLESLCRIIDKGDKALNVPIYNGGLFETLPESFLSENKIADPYLAEAIQLLTIEKPASHEGPRFIDYSSLGVRHLGDIYEGLLEFHVRIADADMVEVKEKNKSLWKRSAEVKEVKSNRIKKKGDIYIENSKHERKATGSYYTPHYIVEYIVKNTIGPVLEERFKGAEKILSEIDDLYEKQRRLLKKPDDWKHWEHPGEPKGEIIDDILQKENNLFETIFDLKALDPAMGSGHFLVHAVDYISDHIITFLAEYPENPVVRRIEDIRSEILKDVSKQGVRIDEDKLTEVNLIKRTVMKRCIYGVDYNEMAVELAKLSLWLDSFTLGAPLSFLDHHLKWGNSLVGTNLAALEDVTKGQLFTINMEPLKRAIRDMLFVSSVSDATYQQVKDSAKKYNEADTNVEGYRILLDILVSEYFGTKDAKRFLLEQGTMIDLNNLKKSLTLMAAKDRKVIEAIEVIAKEKRFFHWEIEFPEVFYERVGDLEQKIEKKKNPGFDCVIGNPPYGAIKEKEYLKKMLPATSQNIDFYSAFMEHSSVFLKTKGLYSFIVPLSWQTGISYDSLRHELLMKYNFKKLVNLPFDVFEDAYIDTSIFVFEKSETSTNEGNQVLVYEFPKHTKVNSLEEINYSAINQPLALRVENQILLSANAISLIARINCEKMIRLGDITISARGVLAKPEQVSVSKKQDWQPFFDGEMYRYEIATTDKFISYTDALPECPSSFDFFTDTRILVRRLVSRQDRIMAHLAEGTFVNKKDIYIFKHNSDIVPYCLLALLNSKLISFIYLSQDVVAKKNDFRQITLEGLRKLPIPRISFTTPEKERMKRVSEGIGLYEEYLLELDSQGAHNDKTAKEADRSMAQPYARGEEEAVSGKHSGAGKRVDGLRRGAGGRGGASGVSEDPSIYTSSTRFIESFINIELSEARNDTIHDLLAYLAEKMIEMNKTRNEEIKGFLTWLAREIGTEIENLTNKTAIKEYHEHGFIQLLEVLKKNKSKLSIDLSSRKNQELIEKHFNESASKLDPLKTRTRVTDEMMDDIVYKLYGLDEDEIKIVKG